MKRLALIAQCVAAVCGWSAAAASEFRPSNVPAKVSDRGLLSLLDGTGNVAKMDMSIRQVDSSRVWPAGWSQTTRVYYA